MLPLNSSGSWGTAASCCLSSCRPRAAVSTPPSNTRPDCSGNSWNRACNKEDLPAQHVYQVRYAD